MPTISRTMTLYNPNMNQRAKYNIQTLEVLLESFF